MEENVSGCFFSEHSVYHTNGKQSPHTPITVKQ